MARWENLVEIEPWNDTDTDWWVGLRLAWEPAFGEAQLRLLAAGRIADFAYRAVAWDDGSRVGFASIARRPGHEEAFALVLVPPEKRGQGVGSALFADLLRESAGVTLSAAMPDDNERSLAIAEHWGFRVVSHAIRSRLELGPGQPGPIDLLDHRVRVIDAASPASDKLWLGPLIIDSDSSPEALELGWRTTADDFERMFPRIVWVVIEEGGKPIGAASASPQEGDAWLLIYTGVLPSHRRQGFARLAKMHLHAVVAERGGRSLTTDNEARNNSILELNASLGYQPIGGEIRLRQQAGHAILT